MHDRPDLDESIAVDHYWDEVLGGTPGDMSTDRLDPTLAETIRHIRRLNAAPDADPEFAKQLWENLLRTHEGERDSSRISRSSGSSEPKAVTESPRVIRRRTEPPGERRRWNVMDRQTIFLMVVVLGIGLIVCKSLWFDVASSGRTIPVPMSTPTESTLFTITVPAEMMPKDGGLAVMSRGAINPATRTSWQGCCDGLRLLYILDGSYTVTFQDVTLVLRAGSAESLTTVPANTALTLGPGDVLISESQTAFEAVNTGVVPVQFFLWGVQHGSGMDGQAPPVNTNSPDDTHSQVASIPSGPLLLDMRRVKLPAGDTYQLSSNIPATNAFALTFDTGADGQPIAGHVTNAGDGRLINQEDRDVTVYTLTFEPADEEASVEGDSRP